MTATLAKGFADPVFESQGVFRAVLDALARPGRPMRLAATPDPPGALHPSAYAVALTLVDADTPLWLSPALRSDVVVDSLRFHCGCPVAGDPAAAAFALVAADDPVPLQAFPIGDDRYPDRSATLVRQVTSLERGAPVALAGPGVDGTVTVRPGGLPADFWPQWAVNHAAYPLGIDLLLVAGAHLIGLPRSVAATPTTEG